MRLPAALRPTSTERITLPSGREIEIPKATPTFYPWPDHRPPLTETFGGKPVLSFGGRPMFAELVVLNMFLDAGWQGRWVETYAAKASGP